MAPRRFSVYAAHGLDWAKCDHGKVAERAQLLIEQWRLLDKLPADKSGAVIKLSAVRWEAWWLVRQCHVHGLAPPAELVELLDLLLGAGTFRNEGPKNREDWRRAVAFEATHPPDPAERRPSTATETAIARHVWGESAQTHRELRAWRHDEIYRRKVCEQRGSN
jgi:hypothetical protein